MLEMNIHLLILGDYYSFQYKWVKQVPEFLMINKLDHLIMGVISNILIEAMHYLKYKVNSIQLGSLELVNPKEGTFKGINII